MHPYKTTDELKRFNQRYTAFAREKWDASAACYKQSDNSSGDIAIAKRPGYGQEEFALQTGAWAIARSNLQTASEPSSSAEEMDVSEVDKNGRYDPKDNYAFTHRVKAAARLYGADMVGITRIGPLWLYACNAKDEPIKLPEGINTAIVMAVEMDYDRIRTSPSPIAGSATGNGYSRMAFTGACVARYLTELGWQAISSGNDTALSIPLAIDAGLGELGRNGMLITPQYGPRVRLLKVFTNAPLQPDQSMDFGVKAFCDVCVKCATTCPSGSIAETPMTSVGPTLSNNPGAVKWYINPETCLAFWRKNGVSCSNCIRSCPFNKSPGKIHDLARCLIKARSRFLNRFLVWIDDICGYGTVRDVRKAMKKFAS